MSELRSYLGGMRGVEEAREPKPPPARWRPAAMPPAVLAEALGVKHSRPELWDVCRDLEDPLRCYRVLVDAAEDKELFGLFIRALMFGKDVNAVVDYLERGDKDGLKEYIYRRT